MVDSYAWGAYARNGVEVQLLSSAQTSKNDALVDQYNIDAIEEFIYDKLADLSKTFDLYIKNSTQRGLSELRCLLGSIFTSGIVWGYPGCLNREISPIYQSIRDAKIPSAPSVINLVS